MMKVRITMIHPEPPGAAMPSAWKKVDYVMHQHVVHHLPLFAGSEGIVPLSRSASVKGPSAGTQTVSSAVQCRA